MHSYIPPPWEEPPDPSKPFFLEVIKRGLKIDDIELTSSHTVFGRNEEVSDIGLYHPTVSRAHAVLQFGPEGDLFISDLGSVHGTRVNQELIPSRTFVKLEFGDIITFGVSSRFYVLSGRLQSVPSELREFCEEFIEEKVPIFSTKRDKELLERVPDEHKEELRMLIDKKHQLNTIIDQLLETRRQQPERFKIVLEKIKEVELELDRTSALIVAFDRFTCK